MADKINRQVDAALVELGNAVERHARAERAMRDALHYETTARNAVNEAQKKVDAVMAEVREHFAPQGSDWARSPSHPVKG